MPDYVEKMLLDIQKCPAMYIGKKSLDYLVTYLAGYMWCVFERDGEMPDYLPGFQKFVENYYDIKSARHWSQIIKFFCMKEEEAFDMFYQLLYEFYDL